MVGIGLLIFRARRDPRENIGQWPTDNYSDASPDSESSFPRNSFSREATAKPLPQRGRYLFPEKQLPPPPSWFSSEDSESVIDVVVEPASPLLHAQFSAPPFSGTPRSSIHIFPESPIPSSNIFGAKPREVSWVAGNDLDRLTVFRTPSYFPQSSRGEHFRTTSMSAVQEGTDQPLGTAQDTEVFALQQLVAKLKGRVQELEVQNKLLQDGRWQPRSVMDHE
ncbi:hypothetical protein C8R46DRAFT_74036 [Mycena filopes]|nr:hypothetical protein C8R46DRAFT_74036 [Mycena filopes]